MSRFHTLLNAIKVRDSKLVTEGVVSLLEEKAALRLDEERKTIAKTTLTEAALQCQECGKTFKKAVSAGSEPKCPKCGSYDVDLKEATTYPVTGRDGKQINITVPPRPCKNCDGEGEINGKSCKTCKGTGNEVDEGFEGAINESHAKNILRVRCVEDNDVFFMNAKELAHHNPDEAAQILALKKGQKLLIGGGAGPTYEITVEGTINESHMPITEVQRVYDETGDIAETEILCGIKNLMISQSGQVVAYISEEVTKKALIREPGYPAGHPAPLYINCACGAKIPGVGHGDVECPTCKQKYDEKGHLKEAFTFPNLSLAHANNRGRPANVPGAPANWAAGFSREWQVGAGGTEVPFVYNGKWFLYVWNTITRKHAYYSYADDTFVDAFNEDWSPEAREAAAEARRKAHGEIQHANSSGQGFHPKHTENPHHETLTKHGYAYSHTTPVGSPSGKWTMHHTYKKGDHNVGVSGHHSNATWEASKSGSGRAHFGKTSADLHKYLKNRK